MNIKDNNNNSKSLDVLLVLGLLAMMWHILFGIISFICALWLLFLRYYLVPKAEKDPVNKHYLYLDHSEIAKKRGWSFEKAYDEWNKIFQLYAKEGDDRKNQKRLWELQGVSKLKQFYLLHIKHIEILVAIMIPFFGILALICGHYGW